MQFSNLQNNDSNYSRPFQFRSRLGHCILWLHNVSDERDFPMANHDRQLRVNCGGKKIESKSSNKESKAAKIVKNTWWIVVYRVNVSARTIQLWNFYRRFNFSMFQNNGQQIKTKGSLVPRDFNCSFKPSPSVEVSFFFFLQMPIICQKNIFSFLFLCVTLITLLS